MNAGERTPRLPKKANQAQEIMAGHLKNALQCLNFALLEYGDLPSDPGLKQALDKAANSIRNALKHASGE